MPLSRPTRRGHLEFFSLIFLAFIFFLIYHHNKYGEKDTIHPIHFNGISTKKMSNNILKSNIAKNIKKLRQEKGISQDRLSKLSDLSLNSIVNIEAGNNPNPTIETLEKIAKAFEVSINELLKK